MIKKEKAQVFRKRLTSAVAPRTVRLRFSADFSFGV